MYDPVDNGMRARQALAAAIAGLPKTFEPDVESKLIALFSDPLGPYAAGRIVRFQQIILDETGVLPEIIKQVPACLKVYFALGPEPGRVIAKLAALAERADFAEACRQLGVAHIQFASTLKRFPA